MENGLRQIEILQDFNVDAYNNNGNSKQIKITKGTILTPYTVVQYNNLRIYTAEFEDEQKNKFQVLIPYTIGTQYVKLNGGGKRRKSRKARSKSRKTKRRHTKKY